MDAKNPFINARVVSHQTDPSKYHQPGVARGQPGFIMSRSELTEFYHCPRRWVRGYRRKDSDALAWGSLVDCLVIEPHTFKDRFAVPPANYPCEPTKKDPRTEKPWTTRADYCKDWEESERLQGRVVVRHEDYLQAQSAAKALFEEPEISAFIKSSQPSVMVVADYWDEATGITVPVKILIDLLPDEHSHYQHGLGDLKTCDSADPDLWARSVFTYNYHVQAAFYLDVYNAATTEERTDFFHILQESYHPYECGKQIMSAEFLELGRLKYQNALREYALCLARNQWPTYGFARRAENWNGWLFTKPQLWMLNAA
jgi:hypothetical protein